MLDSYLSYLTLSYLTLSYLILSIWPKSIGPVLDRMTLDVTGTSTTRTEWDRDGNHRKDRLGRCRAVFGKAIRVLPEFLHTASISAIFDAPFPTSHTQWHWGPTEWWPKPYRKTLGQGAVPRRKFPTLAKRHITVTSMEMYGISIYIYLWHSNIV